MRTSAVLTVFLVASLFGQSVTARKKHRFDYQGIALGQSKKRVAKRRGPLVCRWAEFGVIETCDVKARKKEATLRFYFYKRRLMQIDISFNFAMRHDVLARRLSKKFGRRTQRGQIHDPVNGAVKDRTMWIKNGKRDTALLLSYPPSTATRFTGVGFTLSIMNFRLYRRLRTAHSKRKADKLDL